MDALTFILQLLISLGLVQALILTALLIFIPKKRRITSYFLAGILLVFCVNLWSELMDLLDMPVHFGYMPLLSMVSDLAFSQMIWFVLVFSREPTREFKRGDLVHTLPILLSILWINTGFRKFGIDTSYFGTSISDAVAIFVFYKISVHTIYVAAFLKRLRTPSKLRPAYQSFLTYLVWSYTAFIVSGYTLFILMYVGVELITDADFITSTLATLLVYFITILIISRSEMFFGKSLSLFKYANSPRDPEDQSSMKEKLVAYIEGEKPYLKSDFMLADLAEELSVSNNQVSQFINEELGKTFNDLINEYRLEEVKTRMLDPQHDHLTLLALAYDSGFQSKASFNRIFKKAEGITPQEYKKRNRSHPSQ